MALKGDFKLPVEPNCNSAKQQMSFILVVADKQPTLLNCELPVNICLLLLLPSDVLAGLLLVNILLVTVLEALD